MPWEIGRQIDLLEELVEQLTKELSFDAFPDDALGEAAHSGYQMGVELCLSHLNRRIVELQAEAEYIVDQMAEASQEVGSEDDEDQS